MADKKRRPSNRLEYNAPVADLSGRRHGRVAGVVRGSLYRVEWEDGTKSVEPRATLLSRFTTASPEPAK